MVMIEYWWLNVFIAFWITSRADKKSGQSGYPLCPPFPSRRGHLYFGENRTFLLWVDTSKWQFSGLSAGKKP